MSKSTLEQSAPTPSFEPPKQIQISRAQRRKLDRLEKEANGTLENYLNKMVDAFMDLEPKEFGEFVKLNNAKWLTYCKIKNLTDEAQQAYKTRAYALVIQFERKLDEQVLDLFEVARNNNAQDPDFSHEGQA
jgi:hypothetical protein